MITLHEGEGSSPAKPKQDRVLALHLQVYGCNPPIWRRLLVRESMWLSDLHDAIQIAFGWYDYQTHAFTIGEVLMGNPFKREGVVVEDDRQVTLRDIRLEQQKEVVYDYHFGEGWRVLVQVENVQAYVRGRSYPRCTAGERAGPPEDCGGVAAFHDMLEAISEPYTELGREWLDWLGDAADVEKCDIKAINSALKEISEDGRGAVGR